MPTEWRKFADAMRAVDPTIVLIGPEVHQFTGTPDVDPKDSTGADWMRTFLQIAGDKVDIVSFHRYPVPATSRTALRHHRPNCAPTPPPGTTSCAGCGPPSARKPAATCRWL